MKENVNTEGGQSKFDRIKILTLVTIALLPIACPATMLATDMVNVTPSSKGPLVQWDIPCVSEGDALFVRRPDLEYFRLDRVDLSSSFVSCFE